MSELNKIYEITQQLASPQNLKNDLNEISDMITQHFSAKYLSPISAAMASNQQYYSSHPSKEVNLLKALKPFLSADANIDNAINILNTIRVFSDIAANSTPTLTLTPTSTPAEAVIKTAAIEDSAIHSDGIYEIDQSCVNSKNSTAESAPISESNIIFLLLILIALK
jgi:hypothetical protein